MNFYINFIIYQAVWFLCILQGNKGAFISLVLLALHLILSRFGKNDLKMMALLLCAGLLIDGSLHWIGLFSFNESAIPIPFWLAVIWLGLATLPHHSLVWLKKRPILSSLFGAVGGPLAYWAGVRMGAASFLWPIVPSLILLALCWAVLWPTVMFFAAKDKPVIEKADDHLSNPCQREGKPG